MQLTVEAQSFEQQKAEANMVEAGAFDSEPGTWCAVHETEACSSDMALYGGSTHCEDYVPGAACHMVNRETVPDWSALVTHQPFRDEGHGLYHVDRELDSLDLQQCIHEGRAGTSALVADNAFGLWHWWRRDYRSIRDLIELGIEPIVVPGEYVPDSREA